MAARGRTGRFFNPTQCDFRLRLARAGQKVRGPLDAGEEVDHAGLTKDEARELLGGP